MCGLSEDEEVLTLWQPIHELGGSPKKKADYLATLLRVNAGTTGACFCLDTLYENDDTEWVLIMARIAAQQIDKEEVELTLESVFRMSALYEQAS
jgi:hydrogenase maturation factor